MNYEAREALKAQAWPVVRDRTAPLEARAWAALDGVIAAHYWRAREALVKAPAPMLRQVHGRRYSPCYALDIDNYTRHWLWANGTQLPAEVVGAIARIGYVAEAHELLPTGASMYREGVVG